MAITLEGKDGAEQIKNIMEKVRNNPPSEIGKHKVIKFIDYKKEIKINMQNGKEEKTNLPNSNVLYFELENDNWCCIRPSGTEPKIKFYLGVKSNSEENAKKELENMKQSIAKQKM